MLKADELGEFKELFEFVSNSINKLQCLVQKMAPEWIYLITISDSICMI